MGNRLSPATSDRAARCRCLRGRPTQSSAPACYVQTPWSYEHLYELGTGSTQVKMYDYEEKSVSCSTACATCLLRRSAFTAQCFGAHPRAEEPWKAVRSGRT